MTSILSGLDTVQQALAAQQFALSVTQRNVANANDPSYTRQVAVFDPDQYDGNAGAGGVSIQAARNRYLDFSISQELQESGKQSAMSDALQQIDAVFSGTTGQGLQQAMSDFFNSFSSLSTAPEDLNLRQQVLSKAEALTSEFHRIYAGIQRVQLSENNELASTVNEINSITARIADLNKKVAAAEGANSDDQFQLRDSRQQLLEQLSSLTDLSYFQTESGSITVTTKQGGLLVAGNESHDLSLASAPGGSLMAIQLDGVDITGSLSSGKLGGLLNVRDNYAASYLNTLDDMAAGLISRVNAQHAAGIDLDGAAGGDFFTPFTQPAPGSNTGAARSMSAALDDPRKIAAAAAGAATGDNGNSKSMAAIKDELLFSGSTANASQFYAGLLYSIGSDEKAAEDGASVHSSVLEQLKNQRDGLSGVNLNEEATNLIKYQRAYEASAQFAKVLDSLSQDLISLLGV
jgi:flagellar hook-associated protein 1 FlgK